jgi:hypothetical protein
MKQAIALSLVLAALASPVMAKDAWCYTSDDGEYDCEFVFLDDAGSFEISAPGKPTFQMWMDGDGVAFAGAVFEPGGRSVALPGTYVRSDSDPACWVNADLGAEICAW